MFRAVLPGLLCLLAAPAAAQPPTPPVPAQPPQPAPIRPAQPVPIQPQFVQPVPIPPQSYTFPAMPGGRAPAGGGSEPRVVVAKVVDGALVYKTTGPAPVTRQIDVTVLENGQPVTRKQTVTMMQNAERDVSVPLDGLKVKDAAGKRIQPLNLELRLGDGKGVVLHNGPLPDAIKAMFKDDAVFVEMPGGFGQMAQPVFTTEFIPNGGPAPATIRVRPAPVDGPPMALPATPVQPPARTAPPAPQP